MKLISDEVMKVAEEAGLVFHGNVLPHHRQALLRFVGLCLKNPEKLQYPAKKQKEVSVKQESAIAVNQ